MNTDHNDEGKLAWLSVQPELCQPEQQLIMGMLAFPHGKPLWGDPAHFASTVSWDRFLSRADESIQPYLHWVCQHPPYLSSIPTNVLNHLGAVRHATRVRNLRWASELRAILEVFAHSSVPILLAKGSVLQRSVYPDPSTRPMSDIDLYVKGEDMDRVYDNLGKLGFVPKASRDAQTPLVGDTINEQGLFLKQGATFSLLLEVHTQLEMNFDRQTPPWWRIESMVGTDGISLPCLDVHTALRHICFHLARHGFEHGLMWLLDIRLFVDRHEKSIDWDSFMHECEPAARPLLACTLAMASQWLGARIPVSVLSAIPADIQRAAVPLIWEQVWDAAHVSRAIPIVTIMRSGDVRRIWRHLVDRIRSWTAPLPGSTLPRFVLLFKRLGTAAIIFRDHWRHGSFRRASMQAAHQSDQRTERLHALLWKVKDG